MESVRGILERTKLLRAKEERIAALETENAILHLQIAQLHGSVHQLMQKKASGERCTCYDLYKGKASSLETQLKLLQNELRNLQEQFVTYESQLQNSLQTLLTLVPALLKKSSNRTAEMNELQAKYLQEKTRRKELHNALVELRGNIRVHCRVRPVLDFDWDPQSGHGVTECVRSIDEETVSVRQPRSSISGPVLSEKVYEFDRVHSPLDSQQAVFADVHPLITSLLDGYNVCIMAYGQTGSGKTYTMLGEEEKVTTSEQHGVIPRAAQELFRLITERKQTEEMEVSVSIVEVYNEQVRDLLSVDLTTKHDIISDSTGSMEVSNLTTRCVQSSSDVLALVQRGISRRASDSTLIHKHSSRSHLIVTITVTAGETGTLSTATSTSSLSTEASPAGSPLRPRRPTPSASLSTTIIRPHRRTCSFRTKLQLVDLAGSECVGMSGVTGTALRETQLINKSLSALSDVLGALSENRQHIPYRNSMLTYLLQDSIGGDAKMMLFTCISPTLQYLTESTRVLGFGLRASQIQRGPAKKQKPQRPAALQHTHLH